MDNSPVERSGLWRRHRSQHLGSRNSAGALGRGRLAIRGLVRGISAIVLVAVLAGCSVPGLWTFDDTETGSAGGSFDAPAYAATAWTEKVLPAVQSKAVDAAELLTALAADPAGAATQYGVLAAGSSTPAFAIKGTGTVTKVDTTQPTGPVTVDIGGGKTVDIATGPVILGTALRDVAAISFGDFTNQIDYQDVATQLNAKAKTDVIGAVDKATLTGKTVEFQGAFTALSPTQISVVPTELTVNG